MTAVALIAVCSMLLGALASTAAMTLADTSRSRLERIARQGRWPETSGELHHLAPRVALACGALAVVTLPAAVVCGDAWLDQQGMVGPHQSGLGLVVRLPLFLLVSVLVYALAPRAAARQWGDVFLERTWPFWRMAAWLLGPLLWVTEAFSGALERLAGRREAEHEATIEEEIRTIVSEGHREGLLEEDAREMIEGVIELNTVYVGEIMTPRTDVVAVPVAAPLADVVRAVRDGGHSRIPVFDRNRDDIVGVVYSKDLLVELARPETERSFDLSTIMRRPVFVPESKPVRALLQEFQQSRNHMALVLDEFGGLAGLVTIEDVLEEIVGEIADEHDREIEPIHRINERAAEVLGRIRIDELNEALGLELSSEHDFDTIGGAIFAELGRLPGKGEVLQFGNVRVTVLDVSRRRVERARLEWLDEVPHEPA